MLKSIGIIGTGKMGSEIFNLFNNGNTKIVWIAHREESAEKTKKYAKKQVKKLVKYSDQNLEPEDCLSNIQVSTDYNLLSDCNLIIETVKEDLDVKKQVFEQVERYCLPECILASNTSSIPLERIFEHVDGRSRCMGVHFFYPTKLNRGVEINVLKETSKDLVDKVRTWLEDMGRWTIELKPGANMFFSKLILDLMSQSYLTLLDRQLTVEEIDEIIKEEMMSNGIFEVLDTTGLSIVSNVVKHFITERNQDFYLLFKEKVEALYAENPDKVFSQSIHIEVDNNNSSRKAQCKKTFVLSLKSILLNEITLAINKQLVDKKEVDHLSKEILGLYQQPSEMIVDIGVSKIKTTLDDQYERRSFDVYKMVDFAVWEANRDE